MNVFATEEECGCCHQDIEPGLDTDRALVASFIAGILARDANTPMARALCKRHAELARDALQFVKEHAPAVPS